MTAPDHQIIRDVQRRLRAQQGELGPRQPVPILDQVVGYRGWGRPVTGAGISAWTCPGTWTAAGGGSAAAAM